MREWEGIRKREIIVREKKKTEKIIRDRYAFAHEREKEKKKKRGRGNRRP